MHVLDNAGAGGAAPDAYVRHRCVPHLTAPAAVIATLRPFVDAALS